MPISITALDIDTLLAVKKAGFVGVEQGGYSSKLILKSHSFASTDYCNMDFLSRPRMVF